MNLTVGGVRKRQQRVRSASRDAVMIHHAEFNTQIELDQISEALAAAFIRHRQLSVSY